MLLVGGLRHYNLTAVNVTNWDRMVHNLFLEACKRALKKSCNVINWKEVVILCGNLLNQGIFHVNLAFSSLVDYTLANAD